MGSVQICRRSKNIATSGIDKLKIFAGPGSTGVFFTIFYNNTDAIRHKGWPSDPDMAKRLPVPQYH